MRHLRTYEELEYHGEGDVDIFFKNIEKFLIDNFTYVKLHGYEPKFMIREDGITIQYGMAGRGITYFEITYKTFIGAYMCIYCYSKAEEYETLFDYLYDKITNFMDIEIRKVEAHYSFIFNSDEMNKLNQLEFDIDGYDTILQSKKYNL